MPSSSAGRGTSAAVPNSAHPAASAPAAAPWVLLDPSVLIPLYILLILGGYWFFHSGRGTFAGNEMSRQRALFTVVDAGTLTGFQQAQNDVNSYRPGGQAVALGLIVGGIWFSLVAGGMAVVRIARLPFTDRAVVAWAIGSVLAAGASGAAVAPLRHLAVQASVFQAISAWGNSGLFLGRLPGENNIWTHALLLPLATVGGLGLPVVMDLVRRRRRGSTPLSIHSTAAISWSAGVYLAGAALLLLCGWYANQAESPPWGTLLTDAGCQAINTRSAGFAFSLATYWPRTTQWVAIGLMLIGGASGGTAGGLKVTTLAVLAGGAIRCLGGRPAGRAMGIAIAWVGIYLAMLAITLLLLLSTEPQMPADRLLFLAVSAVGNVGLSHNPLAVSDAGLYVLSGTMLAGRVAPVLVLWWMAEHSGAGEVAVG